MFEHHFDQISLSKRFGQIARRTDEPRFSTVDKASISRNHDNRRASEIGMFTILKVILKFYIFNILPPGVFF